MFLQTFKTVFIKWFNNIEISFLLQFIFRPYFLLQVAIRPPSCHNLKRVNSPTIMTPGKVTGPPPLPPLPPPSYTDRPSLQVISSPGCSRPALNIPTLYSNALCSDSYTSLR